MKNLYTATALTTIGLSLTTLAIVQSSRGLDFSDEGFYLMNLSSSPDNFFHTPFALPLDYFWHLFGESVAAMRLFAIIGLLSASLLWSVTAWRLLASSFGVSAGLSWPLIVGCLTTLSFFGFGLVTPGYNYLSIIGVLTASGALLHQMSDRQGKFPAISSAFFTLMASFGIAISLFGKFSTSFAMLALVTLMTLSQRKSLVSRFFEMLLLLAAVGIFIELMSAGRGLQFVIESISYGAGTVLLMDPTYSPIASISNLLLTSLPAFASASAMLALGYLGQGLTGRRGPYYVLSVALAAAVVTGFAISFTPNSWRPTVFLIIPILWGLIYWKRFPFLGLVALGGHSNAWRLLVILAVSFAAPVVGGNTGFTNAGIYSTPFAMILITLVTHQSPNFKVTPFKLLASLAALTLTWGALTNPYRQPSLLVQNSTTEVATGTLLLDPKRSLEIQTLRECVNKNSLNGAVAIDLTENFNTGLLFALGFSHLPNVIGTPWGYEGSSSLMIRELARQKEADSDVRYVTLIQKSFQEEALSKAKEINLELGPIRCASEDWLILLAEQK